MPTPDPRRICSYCKFHNHDDGDVKITCRKNPPLVVPTAAAYNPTTGATANYVTAWPVINQDLDWCGEWVDEDATPVV